MKESGCARDRAGIRNPPVEGVACVELGAAVLAEQWLIKMLDVGVEANTISYNPVTKARAKSKTALLRCLAVMAAPPHGEPLCG